MGTLQCQTKWIGGLGFSAKARQHEFIMDTGLSSGGKDQGPSPKEVLLGSICACSGIDVASILQKMREPLESLEINSKTETTEGYPSIFSEVELEFRVKGALNEEKVMKAVRLSMTKYCGVSAMVVEASPITFKVFLNEKQIGSGHADFNEVSE